MSKTCKDCGEEKPLDGFYAHSKMADGFLNKCKECVRARVAKHRSENLDQIRSYDRSRGTQEHRIAARKAYAQSTKGKEAQKRRLKNYLERYPEKKQAHNLVSNAVRDGKLSRMPCEVCGCNSAEAHHEDYAKPLEVNWLCKLHHTQRHNELRAMNRDPEGKIYEQV